MDIEELERLVKLMNENGLVELEIEREGQTIRLRKAGSHDGVVLATASVPAAPAPAAPSAPAAPAPPAGPPPGVEEIRSPIVGTFYRSASPDTPPYVNPGDHITSDSVVCIIEAMKVMNEIKAEVRGEVLECLVENGDAVEFDEPLFRVKVER